MFSSNHARKNNRRQDDVLSWFSDDGYSHSRTVPGPIFQWEVQLEGRCGLCLQVCGWRCVLHVGVAPGGIQVESLDQATYICPKLRFRADFLFSQPKKLRSYKLALPAIQRGVLSEFF